MEATPTTRVRRRIFIVDRTMQSDFVVRTVIVMLLFSAAVMAMMFWSIHRYTTLPLSQEVVEAVRYATLSTGIVFVLALAFASCFFIYMSHRIAGPAYRLKRVMSDLMRGDYASRARLRKADYLKDVAAWINRLAEDLETRRERVESALKQAEVLRELVVAQEGSGPKARQLAEAVAAGLREALEIDPKPAESKAP